jgi:hypothetical protein
MRNAVGNIPGDLLVLYDRTFIAVTKQRRTAG